MKLEWNPRRAVGVLEMLFNHRLGFKAANAAAEVFWRDAREYVKQGRAFTNRKNNQRFIRWRFDGPGAVVHVQKLHMRLMEDGTGPHEIKPRDGKKILRLRLAGGGFAYARRVNHPGTGPHRFFFADFAARAERMEKAAAAAVAAKLEAAR